MRFLLGVAEAGFFPGIILYMTYWFRAQDRARTVALFSTAGTLAGFFNSPVSGKLLQLDGVLGSGGMAVALPASKGSLPSSSALLS